MAQTDSSELLTRHTKTSRGDFLQLMKHHMWSSSMVTKHPIWGEPGTVAHACGTTTTHAVCHQDLVGSGHHGHLGCSVLSSTFTVILGFCCIWPYHWFGYCVRECKCLYFYVAGAILDMLVYHQLFNIMHVEAKCDHETLTKAKGPKHCLSCYYNNTY